jgi:glycosyl transferase family 25
MVVKLFVINLSKSADRLTNVQSQGLIIERFAAVDGATHNLSKGEEAFFRHSDFNFKILRGVAACALSHFYLWRKIVSLHLDCAIIFEDDVEICVTDFEKEVNNFQPDFDIIFLYNTNNTTNTNNKIMKYESIKWLGCGAVAYYINNKACRRLVKRVYECGFDRAVDWFIYSFVYELKIGYTLNPLVKHSSKFSSTIADNNLIIL